jgi:DNA repair exonuclease SbcCD ATPase subunit
MLISEIGIKNFRSFGNSRQSVKLNTEKGELILLVGNNGNGKSSYINAFDYALYGKCRGSKKKWTTLTTLPNRINGGDMVVDLKFKSKGTEVEVRRGIGPNILELVENGVLNERAGKSNIDEKIQDYIGMDVETFKSFISMSIDSFKNFISLSNEEKQLLLDKLFNLEVINILNSIVKELNKNNKIRMASLDSEINTLNESIGSIQSSIQKAIEKEKENTQVEIDKIKEDMDSKKTEYIALKEKVEKVKVKDKELQEELDTEKRQYILLQSDIKNVQRDIDLYDSGKCPTCASSFDSEHFISLRETLVQKKSNLESLKLEIESNIKNIKEKMIKLGDISTKITQSFNDITYFLKNCKAQIDKLELKRTKEDGKASQNVNEFYKTIESLEEKKTTSQEYMSMTKDKELCYKELNKVLSEDGVKKSIISGIVKPINHFISENIKKMGLNFEVRLDETFTTEIKHLGTVIDPESLSTGEHKLTNICILTAYLMLIRTKKFINILFLDEVFSSVDLENIQKILGLLKSFANEYNVNIFVVHHAVLNNEMFDRIFKINKEIFSSIEELQFTE